jgi:hypothetical protein
LSHAHLSRFLALFLTLSHTHTSNIIIIVVIVLHLLFCSNTSLHSIIKLVKKEKENRWGKYPGENGFKKSAKVVW